jgi:hypothetical protein
MSYWLNDVAGLVHGLRWLAQPPSALKQALHLVEGERARSLCGP